MRPTILIIEDEVVLHDIFGEALARFGYNALFAVTAADGYAAARAARPDAILLDIALPDAAGTTVLDQFKVIHPDVPGIIMVTANADEELARETLARGAFDYIMKPFDLERLGQVLEAALNRA